MAPECFEGLKRRYRRPPAGGGEGLRVDDQRPGQPLGHLRFPGQGKPGIEQRKWHGNEPGPSSEPLCDRRR